MKNIKLILKQAKRTRRHLIVVGTILILFHLNVLAESLPDFEEGSFPPPFDHPEFGKNPPPRDFAKMKEAFGKEFPDFEEGKLPPTKELSAQAKDFPPGDPNLPKDVEATQGELCNCEKDTEITDLKKKLGHLEDLVVSLKKNYGKPPDMDGEPDFEEGKKRKLSRPNKKKDMVDEEERELDAFLSRYRSGRGSSSNASSASFRSSQGMEMPFSNNSPSMGSSGMGYSGNGSFQASMGGMTGFSGGNPYDMYNPMYRSMNSSQMMMGYSGTSLNSSFSSSMPYQSGMFSGSMGMQPNSTAMSGYGSIYSGIGSTSNYSSGMNPNLSMPTNFSQYGMGAQFGVSGGYSNSYPGLSGSSNSYLGW